MLMQINLYRFWWMRLWYKNSFLIPHVYDVNWKSPGDAIFSHFDHFLKRIFFCFYFLLVFLLLSLLLFHWNILSMVTCNQNVTDRILSDEAKITWRWWNRLVQQHSTHILSIFSCMQNAELHFKYSNIQQYVYTD